MLANQQRIRQIMEDEGVEAIVASMPENVTYLSDYWSLSHWFLKGTQVYAVFPLRNDLAPFLVLPVSDMDLVVESKTCWIKDFVTYGSFFIEPPQEGTSLSSDAMRLQALLSARRHFDEATTALTESLTDIGLSAGKIALDDMNLNTTLFQTIQAKLPNAQFIDGHLLLRKIRSVKTPEEIDRLERAAQITETGFLKSLEAIQEGASELDIHSVFCNTVMEQGGIPLLDCIGAGHRSGFPNVRASEYRVKKNDLIRFDIGCTYRNYNADTARIAVLGTPTAKQRRYYQAIKEGCDQILQHIRPGVRAAELFEIAVTAVQKAGIPHYHRNHVGHGIGIEVYDPPLLAPTSTDVLEEGMVINVETPYYEFGFGGLQVEDTIVVTADGNRLLTRCERDLFVL